LTLEQAKEIYTPENIERIRKYSKNEIIHSGKINGRWEYYDIDNNIIGADIRFEELNTPTGEKPKKTVCTFWYNGKTLKMADGPYIIYNLYNAVKGTGKDKPIVIHEGAKCAKIANSKFDKLESIAYNRGVENADKPDWSHFKNRKVYILPDNDNAGMGAAEKIKSKLPNAIILKSIYVYFEIDDIKSADIEQLFNQSPYEEIEDYILNYTDENYEKEITNKKPVCLGVDDNGHLFFIDRFQRLFGIKRNAVNKSNLMVISKLDYWTACYGNEKGLINWDVVIDDILEISSTVEFDSTKVRGRGAWREGENFIYHDGKNTYGEISGEYMYLRKNKRDIGINETPIDKDTLLKLRNLCDDISFARTSDLIKLLSWSLISPFCGALRFRPGLLLTGESGSGKTTVLENIVMPLTEGKHINTHFSSPAGIRAEVGNDSCALLLEEAEANQNTNDADKNQNRNAFFSMMRASSSDKAPEGIKSNSDQQVVKYSMKNMFLFVSITPTIAEIADDNRIFKVNFTTKNQSSDSRKWETIEKELIQLLSRENCRRIRAYVWKRFAKIVKDTEIIIDVMKYEFKKSSRTADGESILISTYLNIFKDFEMSRENITAFLKRYYKEVGEEEERDETDELVKKIFDEVIEVSVEKERKKISIKECLDCLNKDYYDTFFPSFQYFDSEDKIDGEKKRISRVAEREIRRTLGHYGLSFQRDKTLAIANNNDKLKRILNREDGYAKLFHRHKHFIVQPDGKNDKPCQINNQTQRAVIIDIYKSEKEYDPDVENIPF
jgi:5S rRNA maturation endonuclease (ribonuclease M5)